MKPLYHFIALFWLVVGCCFARADDVPQTEAIAESLEQRVKKSGIDPTVEGLHKYLQSFASTEEGMRMTGQLVGELGSSSYEARESAMQRLSALPTVSLELLKQATKSNDPEVAWRARLLLDRTEEIHRQNYSDVLRLIRAREFKGLSADILFVLQRFGTPQNFKRDVFAAIEVTTVKSDLEMLREILKGDSNFLKVLSVFAMRKVADESMRDEFFAIAIDPGEDDEIKLQAAYGMADLKDRRCQHSFADLLTSKDVVTRVRANAALTALTGQNFKYVAYGNEKDRAEKTQQWRDWVKSNGDTAELHMPLETFKGRSFLNGNTLLAQGYKNKVVELAPDNEVVWEYDTQAPWSAEKLENGNVLIAGYRENRVIEVDAKKNVVWEFPALNVLNARALENGNVLLCLYSGMTVQEVNRNKEVVWEYKATSSLADAIRLPNGNTIIATNNEVAEISPEKKEVWRYDAKQSYGINLTDEGTLLIAQLSGKVIELDREHEKIIWEYETPNPVDAFRLESGNTLITNGTESLEVSPKGEVIWRYPGANYGTARR